MPTYDYACDACGHAFELFQQMSAPVKRTCPKCGKRSLQRLIGIGAGVLFKGGGFYETDYRSESYRKAAEAEKKGGETKAESGAAAGESGGGSSDAAAAAPGKDAGKAPPASSSTPAKSPSGASDAPAKRAKKEPKKPRD